MINWDRRGVCRRGRRCGKNQNRGSGMWWFSGRKGSLACLTEEAGGIIPSCQIEDIYLLESRGPGQRVEEKAYACDGESAQGFLPAHICAGHGKTFRWHHRRWYNVMSYSISDIVWALGGAHSRRVPYPGLWHLGASTEQLFVDLVARFARSTPHRTFLRPILDPSVRLLVW